MTVCAVVCFMLLLFVVVHCFQICFCLFWVVLMHGTECANVNHIGFKDSRIDTPRPCFFCNTV